jgi:hypothetical protein
MKDDNLYKSQMPRNSVTESSVLLRTKHFEIWTVHILLNIWNNLIFKGVRLFLSCDPSYINDWVRMVIRICYLASAVWFIWKPRRSLPGVMNVTHRLMSNGISYENSNLFQTYCFIGLDIIYAKRSTRHTSITDLRWMPSLDLLWITSSTFTLIIS